MKKKDTYQQQLYDIMGHKKGLLVENISINSESIKKVKKGINNKNEIELKRMRVLVNDRLDLIKSKDFTNYILSYSTYIMALISIVISIVSVFYSTNPNIFIESKKYIYFFTFFLACILCRIVYRSYREEKEKHSLLNLGIAIDERLGDLQAKEKRMENREL